MSKQIKVDIDHLSSITAETPGIHAHTATYTFLSFETLLKLVAEAILDGMSEEDAIKAALWLFDKYVPQDLPGVPFYADKWVRDNLRSALPLIIKRLWVYLESTTEDDDAVSVESLSAKLLLLSVAGE